MAKKRRRSTLGALIYLVYLLMFTLISLLIRFILFTYDAITIYTSKYREKSGNSFWKTYFDKGNYGEFLLYRKIIKYFGVTNVFTNLYLEGKNTENTEIDVLAVSPHGIYVFEMKNYGGYIYGDESDQNWTQVFHKRAKYRFYNPLRQNFAHTKAVENYLNVNENNLIPLVVFSNQSKLQKITRTSDKPLIQLREVTPLIKHNFKNKAKIYQANELQIFKEQLLMKTNMSESVKARHIAEVKAVRDNTGKMKNYKL